MRVFSEFPSQCPPPLNMISPSPKVSCLNLQVTLKVYKKADLS